MLNPPPCVVYMLYYYLLMELALDQGGVTTEMSWRQTLEVWNQIASGAVGSLFLTILLDNLDNAFSVRNGAKNFSGSIATCLQSVGQPMPFDRGAIPVLEVGTIV